MQTSKKRPRTSSCHQISHKSACMLNKSKIIQIRHRKSSQSRMGLVLYRQHPHLSSLRIQLLKAFCCSKSVGKSLSWFTSTVGLMSLLVQSQSWLRRLDSYKQSRTAGCHSAETHSWTCKSLLGFSAYPIFCLHPSRMNWIKYGMRQSVRILETESWHPQRKQMKKLTRSLVTYSTSINLSTFSRKSRCSFWKKKAFWESFRRLSSQKDWLRWEQRQAYSCPSLTSSLIMAA